ncbi:homoserine kinase [Ruminococcaceae bacterium OttesenSCG-928-A16]|nr:homoserine kinase [Ruminococcaceae bacterium OttesenSCG-928-A16]
MVTVHVPATSANIGAGFDSLGLALGLGNVVAMAQAEGCHITSADEHAVPTGPDNLVYHAAQLLYQHCGKPFTGLQITQTSPIPMARGLGSSSACIVAGLIGANALLKNPCTREELLTIAAGIEGHPDNVAPALLGGLVASCIENGRVYSVKKEISPTLLFGVFVPNFELLTEKARAALPKTVPHADAVYNLSRAALCQAALCEGRLDLLPVATEDKLHQPYRLPLIEGGEQVFALAKAAGALAVTISGAGPSILTVVEKGNTRFWQTAQQALQTAAQNGEAAGKFTLLQLQPDNLGARLI